jgi:hypothetical protein
MTNQAKKTPRGCLYYGCIMGLVLALMLVVGLLFGLRFARKMINEFTDNKPAPLPALRMEPAQISQVQAKVTAFAESVKAGKTTPALELTGDEINALISTNASLQPLRGKLFVTLEGTQIKGQVSVPMEDLGLPLFRGRYLNGTGTFRLTFAAGILRFLPETLEVKGKRVPDTYLERIRKQNLASRMTEGDPEAAAAFDRLQDIQVKDGKLVIVPKNKPAE